MRLLLGTTVAAAVTAGAFLPAHAQQVCASRDMLVQSLAKDYDEAPVSMGVTAHGNVIEVLSEKDGVTWTILMTMPDGTSCVMAAGEGWMAAPQIALGPDT